MQDNTTPDNSTAEQAANQPLPEETIQVSAESLRSDSVTDTSEAAPATPSEENPEAQELMDWAKSSGMDTSDPVKILKRLRDTQQALHENTNKTSELQKQVSNTNYFDEPNAVIQEARVLNFYNSNPDARNYDVKMGEIYQNYAVSNPEFADQLLRNLPALYAMAKLEDTQQQVVTARQQGMNEAIEATKKAETAAAPSVNATSSAPTPTSWSEERISEVIAKGQYSQYRDEILAWEKSQMGLK